MKKHNQTNLLGRWSILFCFALPFTGQANAQHITTTLNDNWHFLKGECTAASAPTLDDSSWQKINLPHTWNTDAYATKNYYRGVGWYRKTLKLPTNRQGKQFFLKLEGASKSATIYLNGQEVGTHAGGYTACTFNITPYLSDASNVLAIKVDNSREDIAPISGDFTFFGGIYRDVWITSLPDQHFNLTNHGSDGIFIQTPTVDEQQGTIAIRCELTNDANRNTTVDVIHRIYQPDGSLLQTVKETVHLNPNETRSTHKTTQPIVRPQLWSPESPALYRVESQLFNHQTKALLDESSHYTAFRWFKFDSEKGFFLNGKPYKLHGVCRHQDQKPIGSALTDEMHRRDFKLMKEMGANFIRISHYPQDEALLEMCDRMGMLAWEEIPVIDIVPDTPGYADNCERNLREMIRQHYNHPSVITWGYMNEILLVTQRRYKTEQELKPVLERTLALANRLEKVLKQEDSSRLSTIAFHGSDSYNQEGLSQITDIVGWNLYNGWYGGDVTGFEKFLEEQHRNHPTHPIVVSEYGAGSDKRLHSLHPHAFDFCIEYQQQFLEHYLPVIEDTPYICGGTHWNFIDFSSALRGESMPRINNKGLVYANRTPKDVYHYYKASWRKDQPVLYIASRDWVQRCGIADENGVVMQPVKVYSNLSEVELFLNGLSLGKKTVKNGKAVFDVPFTQGEQLLLAQGIPTPGHGMSFAANKKRPATVYDALSVHCQVFSPDLSKGLQTEELAINVGSNCFFTSDESGLTWLPDQPYKLGSWGYLGGKEQVTQTEIEHTADGPLFQTFRNDIKGYRFDVPEGTYELELLFADLSKSKSTPLYLLKDTKSKEDKNVNQFDIYVNNTPLESGLSISDGDHYYQAVRKRYIVTLDTNHLDVQFINIKGKNFLNGIKIRRMY